MNDSLEFQQYFFQADFKPNKKHFQSLGEQTSTDNQNQSQDNVKSPHSF
jgi:hypothetical protein